MPTTTAHHAEPILVLPSTPAARDAPLQLEHETQPPCGPHRIRILNHPHELALRGIPVMCSACGARRDWLLINQGRNVWIRCRCPNEWLEPEIRRAGYDAMIAVPDGTTYPSIQQALIALGFDGSFAGAYLE